MTRVSLTLAGALLLSISSGLLGQTANTPTLAGDYAGMLGPYHVKLHVVADPNGRLTGTVDNSDMGMIGVPCDNIRVEGKTLSLTVPTLQGTWTGFVSADGNSLSGMWSQDANPVPLNFTRSNGNSQTAGGANAQGEVKWDNYVFKFLPGGNMVQVFEDGKMAGTILTVNGQQRVVPAPGADAAKLQKSYEDYQTFNARSHGQAPPATTPAATVPIAPTSSAAMPTGAVSPAPAPGPDPKSLGFSNDGKADPAGIKFEGKTVTVPRTDGMVVVFNGEDVNISNARGPMYVLRHKKASVGRAFEQSLDHRNAVGGGVAGGGIEFLRAGGGLIYDSGMGGYNVQESPGVRIAKQLALVAVDAADAVRQVPGHAGFKPPGYTALKDVSQYRLRSDGSR